MKNFRFIIEFKNVPDTMPADVAKQLASQACLNILTDSLEDDTDYTFAFNDVTEHPIS